MGKNKPKILFLFLLFNRKAQKPNQKTWERSTKRLASSLCNLLLCPFCSWGTSIFGPKCMKDSKIQLRKRPPLISRKRRHHVKTREKRKDYDSKSLVLDYFSQRTNHILKVRHDYDSVYLYIIFHRKSRTSTPFSTCIKEVGSMIFYRLSITTNKCADQICMKVLKIIWHDDFYTNVVL